MVTLEQRIRYAPSFVRFAMVGALATIVDFSTFNILLGGNGDPSTPHLLIAATTGFTIATYTSYQFNSRFTFRAGRSRAAMTRYFVIAVGGVLIHNATLLALRAAFDPGTLIELNVTKLGALSASMLWNYVGYRQFSFR
jgi:putative flippase GtrA